MNQKIAQEIIQNTYGDNAYAIGHTESDNEVVIFWIYNNENENNFKCHVISK